MKNLVKKVMTLISWLKNRKSFSNPKKLNLSNILNYAETEFQKWKSTSSFLKAERHIEEQSVWRLQKIKKWSPECLIPTGFCTNNCGSFGHVDGICLECGSGFYSEDIDIRCKICGCEVYSKTFEMDGCSGGCYPKRMSIKEWDAYCEKNNITIN